MKDKVIEGQINFWHYIIHIGEAEIGCYFELSNKISCNFGFSQMKILPGRCISL